MPSKRVAFVRLDINDRALFYDALDLELSSDDVVMVEHDVGMESGRVVIPPIIVDVPNENLPRIIRKATSEDMRRIETARQKEREAFRFCKERIEARELPMKLLKVEAWLDGSKILFYFWAENRVDFRELVKDLARRFRTRIELRQIGVRDAARILGGIGPCGRITCCSSWVRQFESISIKMAKDQSLALNPSKVSGICGRLLCCLGYEFGQYEDALKWLPPVGKRVSTPRGEGRIVRVNAYLQKVYVVIDGETQEVEFSPKDVRVLEPQDRSERQAKEKKRDKEGKPEESKEGERSSDDG
ncbi:MAG TPA: stage 0 sporulation protein [Proteobacteria bacterium]|nr:stage 0 sporulation protein [Pseudomonadota bacterium]